MKTLLRRLFTNDSSHRFIQRGLAWLAELLLFSGDVLCPIFAQLVDLGFDRFTLFEFRLCLLYTSDAADE